MKTCFVCGQVDQESVVNRVRRQLLSSHLNTALCHLKGKNKVDALKACDSLLLLMPEGKLKARALYAKGKAKFELEIEAAEVTAMDD